ncbi:cache domain-containing protein [Paenibacillus flagellatus]|uniref:Cache domain-containing protein n=1 Tax=Paenibacillus flagellatus TaxID=2211139 RepID=A0A2V5KC89_9BACL|nr:cache domain-containing protein [Paenibacillus flagellatus]PYI55553.1 hypothetical protein DLM86_07420 [Paenibacillus flagellatus]
MFKRLSRRIVLITLLSVSAFTVAIGFFSYYWAKRTVLSEFIAVSTNYFQSSNDLLAQYLNYTGETAKMIANNPNVAGAVEKPHVSSEVSPLLDSLAYGMNTDIRGISLYKTDGTIYSLSGMSNLPSLEQLRQEEPIRRFIESAEPKSMWISRYKHLSSYYNYRYGANGTFSYLLKWTDDRGAVSGIMVIDLDANRLFGFFQTDNSIFVQNRLYMLRDGDNLIRSSPGDQAESLDPDDLGQLTGSEGKFVSADGGRLILYNTIMDSNTKIVASIPLKQSISHLSAMKGAVVLLALFSCIGAALLAAMLRTSIVRPLSQLYVKMKAIK